MASQQWGYQSSQLALGVGVQLVSAGSSSLANQLWKYLALGVALKLVSYGSSSLSSQRWKQQSSQLALGVAVQPVSSRSNSLAIVSPSSRSLAIGSAGSSCVASSSGSGSLTSQLWKQQPTQLGLGVAVELVSSESSILASQLFK